MSHAASAPPRISVVVPTRDTRRLTLACLASLEAAREQGVALEVVLLDDASGDGTAEAVRERFPHVRVLRNERPEGFTRAANRGLTAARGDVLLLLNSDTEVEPEAWQALESGLRRNRELGVAGALLRFPDGTPQWSGGPEPDLPWLFALASGLPPALSRLPGLRALRPVRGHGDRPVHWVTGAAMAIRRRVWEEVGPFDPAFHLYCQDLDFCTRARRAGWRVAVVDGFRVLHHHGATIGRQAGAAGRHNPELLWCELVRWMGKHGGPGRARRAALALRAGGRLRLTGRWLITSLRPRRTREAWRRDSRSYRRALAAVGREARREGRRP